MFSLGWPVRDPSFAAPSLPKGCGFDREEVHLEVQGGVVVHVLTLEDGAGVDGLPHRIDFTDPERKKQKAP